ncbi:MAG: MopE-related protein [Polyangiaceae bacterium]
MIDDPGATPMTEVCNAVDDDCDGLIDEDDNGLPLDCPTCQPTPEICDGLDNDCDFNIDEEPDVSMNQPGEFGVPCDEPTAPNDQPPCKAGVVTCINAKPVCIGAVGPQPELCNGKDDDCDGVADNMAECPGESICVEGVCVNKCASGEFPCPRLHLCRRLLLPPTRVKASGARDRSARRAPLRLLHRRQRRRRHRRPDRAAPATPAHKPAAAQAVRPAADRPVPTTREFTGRSPAAEAATAPRPRAPPRLAVSSSPSAASPWPSAGAARRALSPGRRPRDAKPAPLPRRGVPRLHGRDCQSRPLGLHRRPLLLRPLQRRLHHRRHGRHRREHRRNPGRRVQPHGRHRQRRDANTATDVKNCGECGNVCMLAGATAQCFLGKCEIDTCFDGKYDVDGDPSNGCEYTCVVPVPGPELCNGLDDDCDGLTDSDDPDLVPPPNFCTTTPGTPCENTQILCNGAAGWSCSYPAGVEVVQGFVKLTESKCDGIDGNCDGQIDEWFTDLGKPCSDMGVSQCKDFGLIVCDPQNAATTKCDLSFPAKRRAAGPEQCNGKDDDCNGLIDDNLPDEAFAMEPIPGTSPVVLVDRHEASRPDATLMTAGILETVACSRPMVLPWTGGGYPEAEAACASRGPGYRLCTAQELEKACRGAADTLYPYGDTYETLTCNGADQPVQGVVATGTLAACTVTGTQVTDLSGNVTEWTSTQTNADPARAASSSSTAARTSPPASASPAPSSCPPAPPSPPSSPTSASAAAGLTRTRAQAHPQ